MGIDFLFSFDRGAVAKRILAAGGGIRFELKFMIGIMCQAKVNMHANSIEIL